MSDQEQPAAEQIPSAENNNRFHIVGIGASAGGLEALETFFRNMPATDDFAFVVIQHLSPDYKSLMGELLSKHTKMDIHQVEDGMEVQPGSIYLIPRKNNMTMFQRRLFLYEKEHGLNLPIDIFFRSLAEDQGERSIGIVLSGTGSDGTRGLRAIKESGGMVMVQDEETAKFDGMPKSAGSTGIVDYILPPSKMPEELVNYINGNYTLSKMKKTRNLTPVSSLTKIIAMIKDSTGVDLSFYKESTIIRRIERRMGINQIDNIDQYIKYMEEYPGETQTLFKEILIGVTKFFRDPDAFEFVKTNVLDEIFSKKEPNDAVRIWVPGCSTGEEAYSAAILLAEYAEENNIHNDIKIFATDIDRNAIEYASYGVYPESIAADASVDRLSKYFLRKGDSYQIVPRLREQVVFAYHNVFKDPPFRKIDLITCRNMLIYFQPVLQKKVLSNFHFSLNENGFLFLGSSETVGEYINFFSVYDAKWKVYRYKGGYKPKESTDAVEQSSRVDNYLQEVQTRTPNYTKTPRDVESVYEKIIEEYLPPSVMVSEDRKVMHIFGDVNTYLKLPLGKIDLDVVKMANEGVSIPIGTALHTAIQEKREVIYKDVITKQKDKPLSFDLLIKPVKALFDTSYYLILFKPKEEIEENSKLEQQYDAAESAKTRIEDLERELQYTKENLQATIEELETSNEELQATNEELLASNEELQSTNEELQSVNEELITVNSEYQKKIEELQQLNDDIDNLLNSTDIGTIFLDQNLKIRKFTPAVENFIKILDGDIGRNISDLNLNLQYDDFIDDVRFVLRNLEPKVLEIQDRNNRWLNFRIIPYRGESDMVSGVVITMLDIDERKRMELSLLKQRDQMQNLVDISPVALTVVDVNGVITMANARAKEVLDLHFTEETRRYDDPTFKITDLEGNPVDSNDLPFARLRARAENQGADGTGARAAEVKDYRHKVVHQDGKEIALSISGHALTDEKGVFDGAVFTLEPLSEGC
ncbi:MAG: PAS domain-containing protein [Spirochaetales bacterium]|nr:PAS domain-containing protein [Spirochaetales bacterium]MCF7938480.1 PAS domain-containing protein [Spirochaetales bacterium]